MTDDRTGRGAKIKQEVPRPTPQEDEELAPIKNPEKEPGEPADLDSGEDLSD